MNTEIIRVNKWFWAWQDEQEEAWLRSMAQQGLHLKKVEAFGSYAFERGKSRDTIHRLDFISHSQGDRAEYLQLFKDGGWEYLGEMMGWQYFRKPAGSPGASEIFSDNDSKAEKYRRLILFLLALLPIWFSAFATLTRDISSPAKAVITIVLSVFVLFYLFVMVSLFTRMNQLKKKL